jgi:transporter family protein
MSHILLLALVALVLLGLADFFIKKGMSIGLEGNAMVFWSMIIASLPFGVLLLVEWVPLRPGGALAGYSITIGGLMFIGTISLLAALKVGEASIVIPLGRLGFVVTALCAFIFLGEPLTVTKALGILCAVTAVILLSRN